MNNALQCFQFDAEPLRLIPGADGSAWFVANDICKILNIKNARQAIEGLDDDEKGVSLTYTLGGPQEVNIISEGGMWTLLLRSRDALKPGTLAHRVRRWFTGEVIPAIRRTGTYSLLGDPSGRTLGQAIRAVTEARRLYGKEAAREVWQSFGLPTPRLGVHDGDAGEDPWLELVGQALADRTQVTIDELLDLLDVEARTTNVRRRLGLLIRAHGWASTGTRRGNRIVKVFAPVVEA